MKPTSVGMIWFPSDVHCFDGQNGDERNQDCIERNDRRYPFGFKDKNWASFMLKDLLPFFIDDSLLTYIYINRSDCP
jgi:hypothetical protein